MILLKKFETFKEIYDGREYHIKFHQIDRDKIICELNKRF